MSDINDELNNVLDEFKKEFDSLDILTQIQICFYLSSGVVISREKAAQYMYYVFIKKGFQFFKELVFRSYGKDGDSNDE